MTNKQIFPTKGNLIATRKSSKLAHLGYDLMDRKRNILTREMMSLLDSVKLLRDEITVTYNSAYNALQQANISLGVISNLVEVVPIDMGVRVNYRSVMGIEIPKVEYDEQEFKVVYGMGHTNSKLDYAYQCFYKVKELTILLAQIENSVYRLANAIRKAQKRANALKNIVIPNLENNITFISNALEEKEREEFSRQKLIKAIKARENR